MMHSAEPVLQHAADGNTWAQQGPACEDEPANRVTVAMQERIAELHTGRPAAAQPFGRAKQEGQSYYEYLYHRDKAQWKSELKAPVNTKEVRREIEELLKSKNEARQASGRAMEVCCKRMRACEKDRMCGVVACKRCGRRKTFEEATRLAIIASNYSRARTGRLIVFGVNSDLWHTEIGYGYKQLQSDLRKLTKVLDSEACIDGYCLSLDAALDEFSADFDDDTSVEKLDQIPLNLHIHGLLLVEGDRARKIAGKINAELHLRGIDVVCWFDTVEGTYVSSTGKKRRDVCTFRDVVRWTCYQEKLQNGGKGLPANVVRVLQRSLVGKQRRWLGGRFARSNANDTLYDVVKRLEPCIADLTNQAHQWELGDLDLTELSDLSSLTERLVQEINKKEDRLRKRMAREKEAMELIQKTWCPKHAQTLKEEWRRRRKAHRERYQPDIKKSEAFIRQSWQQIEPRLAALMLRLALLLARRPAALTAATNRWLDEFGGNPLLAGVTIMAAILTSTRRMLELRRELAQAEANNQVPKALGRLSIRTSPQSQTVLNSLTRQFSLLDEANECWQGHLAAFKGIASEDGTVHIDWQRFRADLRNWASTIYL